MKKRTFALIATMVGVASVKFFWIVVITSTIILCVRFTAVKIRNRKKPKDNKIMWQPWSDR